MKIDGSLRDCFKTYQKRTTAMPSTGNKTKKIVVDRVKVSKNVYYSTAGGGFKRKKVQVWKNVYKYVDPGEEPPAKDGKELVDRVKVSKNVYYSTAGGGFKRKKVQVWKNVYKCVKDKDKEEADADADADGAEVVETPTLAEDPPDDKDDCIEATKRKDDELSSTTTSLLITGFTGSNRNGNSDVIIICKDYTKHDDSQMFLNIQEFCRLKSIEKEHADYSLRRSDKQATFTPKGHFDRFGTTTDIPYFDTPARLEAFIKLVKNMDRYDQIFCTTFSDVILNDHKSLDIVKKYFAERDSEDPVEESIKTLSFIQNDHVPSEESPQEIWEKYNSIEKARPTSRVALENRRKHTDETDSDSESDEE